MDWGLHGMPQQVDERLRDYYSRRRGLREWRPVGGAITKPAAVPGRPMRNAGNQTLISTNHKDSTLKLKNSKSKLIRNGFNLKVKNAQPNRLNGGSDVTPSPSKIQIFWRAKRAENWLRKNWTKIFTKI